MFHPDLQVAIKGIKELVAQGNSFSSTVVSFVTDICYLIESWEQKGKFPPSLKPPLANLAILAIKLDEYDDDFFALMPMLFPYNKFTMTVRVSLSCFTWDLCV
jgi:Ubinuclein conserved middle domain